MLQFFHHGMMGRLAALPETAPVIPTALFILKTRPWKCKTISCIYSSFLLPTRFSAMRKVAPTDGSCWVHESTNMTWQNYQAQRQTTASFPLSNVPLLSPSEAFFPRPFSFRQPDSWSPKLGCPRTCQGICCYIGVPTTFFSTLFSLLLI